MGARVHWEVIADSFLVQSASLGSWFCFVPMQKSLQEVEIDTENGFPSRSWCLSVVTLGLSQSWINKIGDDSKYFCLWCGQVKTTIRSPCFQFTLPTSWKIHGSPRPVRYFQCETARLVCSGQFKGHLQYQRIWQGWVKGLPKPLFYPNWARRPKCLPWKYIDVSKSPFCCSSPLLHFASYGSKTLQDLLCLAHMALDH